VFVRIDVNRGVFQDETDIIAAVFAGRKDLPEHTGHFVLVRVLGVVQDAVDTRALTFLTCSEYIAGDGIGHNRHALVDYRVIILFRKAERRCDQCHNRAACEAIERGNKLAAGRIELKETNDREWRVTSQSAKLPVSFGTCRYYRETEPLPDSELCLTLFCCAPYNAKRPHPDHHAGGLRVKRAGRRTRLGRLLRRFQVDSGPDF
jgi:hypothetical protein